jgi:hypothetical protein
VSPQRPLRILAAFAFALVAACELVVGIRDRPLAGESDASPDVGATTPVEAESDALGDTTVEAEGEDVTMTSDSLMSEAASSDAIATADHPPPREAGPCDYALVPGPPGFDDGDAANDLVLQLAIHTVDLGIRYGSTAEAGPPFPGYNLDGLLSCPDQPCMPKRPQMSNCDAGLWCGVDNAALPLFQTFAQLTNGRFNQQAFNDELALGTYGIVFRVRFYNGGANDQNVEVALFDSNGTPPGDGGSPEHVPPLWDGTDIWTLDYGSVIGGSGAGAYPREIDINAYVTNRVLVAHVDHPITLYGGTILGTLVFETSGTTFTATLTPDEKGGFHVDDGVIAGRWPTKYMQSGLKAVTDPLVDGAYLCPTPTSSYPTIAKIICNGADMTADPRAQSASTACDAISFATSFTASTAVMGSVTMRSPPQTTCPDSGLENCEY